MEIEKLANSVTIKDAAKLLHVTDKTIRNYIKRGFLKPDKWNGAWQIARGDLVGMRRKKTGKSTEEPISFSGIEVSREEYGQQMIAFGKVQAYEDLLRHQKEEISRWTDRVAQLEASGASGWAEARNARAECKSLKSQLESIEIEATRTRDALKWMQREKDGLAQNLSEECDRNRRLVEKIKDLEGQVHMLGLFR